MLCSFFGVISKAPLLSLAVGCRDRDQSKSPRFQRFSALRAGPIHSSPVDPLMTSALCRVSVCLSLPL